MCKDQWTGTSEMRKYN